jgi:spermidine synthase
LTHPDVRYQGRDIRDALPTLGVYDVIILDLPDPDGDTGYLYSDEFMRDIKGHLVVGGGIVTHCGPVLPFGRIGDGFQRLLPQFGIAGFYTQMIPSFQSEWGFIIWRDDNLEESDSDTNTVLPEGLRVVDKVQLDAWFHPTRLWRTAILSC